MKERYENIREMNEIPDEVPQWVLTQDAIFDAIGTQFYLANEFQQLLKTIKDKEWKK